MRIAITGATGFVGSHVTRQLIAGGYAVRLLVRDADKARAMYAGFANAAIEYVSGDVTDADSVRVMLEDCNAVVHAAAGTPFGGQSKEALFAVNVGGVKNVVSNALASGVQHIVCISSITAIFNTDGEKVTADSPPTPSRMPYGQSKVEAEYFLRELQDSGSPIATVYPGGIIGPDDPGLSDSSFSIKYRIENGFRVFGDGGTQYVDVRDLAALVVSLATQGGSGRFLLPGQFVRWTDLADLIEAVSGCTLQRIPAAGWKLRLVGRMVDLLRLFKKVDSPISAETMRYATLWTQMQNTGELTRRGLAFRPIEDTFRDTLCWMLGAGHLDPSLCPSLQGVDELHS